MFFKEIELKNFRSYNDQKVEFHEKVNIIQGDNAQGKTNLLESLYIMCISKSFRTNIDSEMIRFGNEEAYIKSIASRNDRDIKIEIAIKKNEKIIKIDGQKLNKKSDFLNQIHIVVFSPEDLKIVKDEPEKRRRFIDREICQIKPVYYKNLSRYKKILLQRNNILKNDDINFDVLSVWDDELIEYGSKIIIERQKFIKGLSLISKKIHEDITLGKENLEIQYESNIALKECLDEQKTQFKKELDISKKADLHRKVTLAGPHKDDIKICVNGIDIRRYGSQGQQRTAALSLKLAEIKLIEDESGDTPILLLDDVLSELDITRQTFLIHSLKGIQLFLTTTDINDMIIKNLKENATFFIQKGQNDEDFSYVKKN